VPPMEAAITQPITNDAHMVPNRIAHSRCRARTHFRQCLRQLPPWVPEAARSAAPAPHWEGFDEVVGAL